MDGQTVMGDVTGTFKLRGGSRPLSEPVILTHHLWCDQFSVVFAAATLK
ncbi:hypothetical protein ACMT4L_03275 [Deinococcus sp. A31D244]|uniref:Uncharacterized protein n=1 Tax=Deinococcus aquaticus TaxID=328692 RepID=A0ABY7V6T2_9DEIO|nr:hypothetical protein [Deinococcus aquaticus]WDA60324.1 hypothetical protein M8445_16675 [Deinococcus aquaticus]